jgi:ribulose-phosphate 3-epimerase
LHRSIQVLKDLGVKAGVAINPHTNISLLEDIICHVDMILIMSVNPGFGGQKFIENTYDKIKKLKNIILSKNTNTLIEIDGGVNLDNASKLFNAGADILVAGNTVFSSDDPTKTILDLKK